MTDKIITPEEQAAFREKDRQRKREERARKKLEDAAAATQAEQAQADTLQEFWAASITTADQKKLTGWKERQEEVFDTLHWMNQVMDGTYNVDPSETEYYVGIEEGDEDIERMVRDYGEVAAITLLLGKFWQNPELLTELTKDENPTAIFLKYGILVGLPEVRLRKWDEFIKARRPSQQLTHVMQNTFFYATIKCTGCDAPPTSVSVTTAEAYRRSNNFLCQNCLDKRAKARDFSQGGTLHENVIFDSWGRVRDIRLTAQAEEK
jgi:hypothetical protein